MSKGLIDLLLDQIFDADWLGRHGEKLTERELKLVNFFGRKGRVLRNLYIPKENGETSEIDVVYITQKGIFVIESKNYSGWVFGDEQAMYWTVMLPTREKNRLYNPIKQNATHIKWLRQYLHNEVPLFSLIVFSERCELKKVTVSSGDIRVIKRDRLYANVRDIWDKNPDVMNEEQVEELTDQLEILTDVDEAVKASHVASIQDRFQKPENGKRCSNANAYKAGAETPEKLSSQNSSQTISNGETDIQSSVESNDVCPLCGSKLILRTARKGMNAGNQFYGCSNFPKCRYTRNV